MADLILILIGVVIGLISGYIIWEYGDDDRKKSSAGTNSGGVSDRVDDGTGREDKFA